MRADERCVIHAPCWIIAESKSCHQVIPRIGSPLRDQLAHILRERIEGRCNAGVHCQRRVKAIGQRIRPGMEALLILARHPEQFADDRHWEWIRKALDKIKRFLVLLGVEQCGHCCGNTSLHSRDPFWRELMHDESSQAIMLRGVEKEYPLFRDGTQSFNRDLAFALLFAYTRVMQQRENLVVRADDDLILVQLRTGVSRICS